VRLMFIMMMVSSMLLLSVPGAGASETGMVGWWPLDEGYGRTVYDLSVLRTNGTIYGAAWAAGLTGSCPELTGPGEFILIPHREEFDFDKEFTVSAWICPFALAEGVIFGNGDGHLSGYVFQLNDGGLSAVLKRDGQTCRRIGYSVTTPKLLQENVWSHVSITYDGAQNGVRFFCDGARAGIRLKDKEAAELSPAGRIRYHEKWEDANVAQVSIGTSPIFPLRFGQFRGLIRDVKLYRRALSDEEIMADYLRSAASIGALKVTTTRDRERSWLTCRIKGRTVDEKGNPVEAKLSLSVNGKYYFPDDTLSWGDRNGASFISPRGGFALGVPPGKIRIEAFGGPEFFTASLELEMKDKSEQELIIEMKRLVDMPSLGWYGGEHHLHSYGHGKGKTYDFFQRPDGWRWWAAAAMAAGFNYVSSPVPNPQGNIASAWNDRFICASTTEGGPWLDETCKIWKAVGGGGICMIPDITAAEKAGVLAVPQGYPDNWQELFFDSNVFGFDRSFPVAVALEKVYIWDVYYRGKAVTAKDWYRYLNSGFKLGIGSGSDEYLSISPAPEAKEYTKLESLSWPEVIKGYKRRCTFWTSGPLVVCKINGRDIGDTVFLPVNGSGKALLSIEAWDRYGLQRIEVVRNGEVLQTLDLTDNPAHTGKELQLNIENTCWLALRLYGGRGGFAHTSPIYIQYGDRPMVPRQEDIDYFLNWVKMYRKFVVDNAEKQKVAPDVLTQTLNWIGQAENVYQGLSKPANYRKW